MEQHLTWLMIHAPWLSDRWEGLCGWFRAYQQEIAFVVVATVVTTMLYFTMVDYGRVL